MTERREGSHKVCPVCGAEVKRKKVDAIYCSPACTKKGYVANNKEKRKKTQKAYRDKTNLKVLAKGLEEFNAETLKKGLQESFDKLHPEFKFRDLGMEILRHKYLYYVKGEPEISDFEYDMLEDQYVKLAETLKEEPKEHLICSWKELNDGEGAIIVGYDENHPFVKELKL